MKREKFDAIHCNTPSGGVLGRLAGKKCKVRKIIYQAHGFHFYKDAPKKNWLIYYPIEKWLAKYTDALITINNEDYELAKSKFQLRHNGKVYYVPGVGIDLSQYDLSDGIREKKRTELGLKETDFALIYQHPYTKHILNNTAKISADSINASLLFPYAYQQTKANNGETAVNPNQIIA